MSPSPEPEGTPAREPPGTDALPEGLFRRTLENVSLVAMALDRDGTVTFANDFLLSLTGRTREEVIGRDWFELFDPDPEVRSDFASRVETGDLRSHYEGKLVTRSGEERTISWSTTLQVDEEGASVGIVAIGEDVTERRRAERLLREREELFRSLIENTTDVIGIVGQDRAFIYESPSVERVLGWKPEELVGTPAIALVHGADVPAVDAAYDAVLAGEAIGPTVVRLRHRSGTWRTVEAYLTPLDQGEDMVIVCNYRDVTEHRALQEQLSHAQKLEAVGRLAGGIAHDFNNLLTAIGGYAQLLVTSLPDDDVRREDAEEIVRAAERASALTGQLLTFSRRQVLATEVVDFGEVVVGLGRMLARLLGGHVTLVSRVESGCLVRADRGQLEQVVTNLVVNARDAMPRGGSVEVAVECGERHVELTVTDTGVGMDVDTIERIFEPFFTTKEAGEGTGLGLATVYGIVTQAGGEISVSSVLEEGTTFRIVLPLEREGESAEPGEQQLEMLPGKESVLLVDDEEAIRRLVAEVLARHGYDVHAAANADEALALLAGRSYDLLLTDVVMPGLNGPALARRAKERHPELKVLFTSGYTSEPDVAFDDPKVEFIGKPFSPQALAAKVRDVLDA